MREYFRVLWDVFKGDMLPAMARKLAPPAGDLTPAERAMALAEAVYTMAKQQVTLERWLVHHDARLDAVEDIALAAHDAAEAAHGRLDKAAELVKGLQLREYGPYQVINKAQAAEPAETVKGIAHRLTLRDPEEIRAYQRVWGELHRRYNVTTTYRRVPAAKFGEVVTWLDEWLGTLATGGDPESDQAKEE